MLKFQGQLLKQELDQLPRGSRVAFAVSCAQRLVGVYRSIAVSSGQTDRANVVDHVMDYVWTHILVAHDKETADGLLAKIMVSIPDEDAPGWTPPTPYAEDALSAVAYSLECLQSGGAQEAAWAARRVYEALAYFVIERLNILPSEPQEEARVVCDNAIQAELERQARDLVELAAAGDSLSQQLLNTLRRRSAAEQADVLAS